MAKRRKTLIFNDPLITHLMKLIYHRGQNFGDALNPLIFEHFLNDGALNESSDIELLGIGTIFGLKQSELKKVVFSSGISDDEATYGAIPQIDGKYDIRAVRGPLTAELLNISTRLAVTDGAALVAKVFPRSIMSVPSQVGFIPHHKSLDFYSDWETVANSAGLTFLDIRQKPKSFLRQLWTCEAVITEAMHGAIVADTYSIPWIPIKLYSHINEFKWMDWAASVRVDMQFHASRSQLHSSGFFADLMMARGFPKIFAKLLSRALLQWRIRRTVIWLKALPDSKKYLSDRDHLSSLIDELLLRLEKVKSDYTVGDINRD